MNDILIQNWINLQDKLRRLNIVAGVDWDTTSDDKYVTSVFIFQDVKLEPFYYATYDLEDLLSNLEGYYEKALRKNKQQKSLDILNRLDWAFMHLIVYGFTFAVCSVVTFISYMIYKSGIAPQILEMLK